MKKIIFYSYPKCSTCRKAKKWLDQNIINYKFVDIVKEPPLNKFLELALINYSLDKKRLFNIRGKSFKSIDFDVLDLTNKEMIELLSNDWKLIKRPFVVINESKLILGFNESEYAANFK